MRALQVMLPLAAILGGCAAEVEVPWLPASSDLEVGTGEAEFTPLEQESPLPIVLGPQGGYHVVGNIRARGVVPSDEIDDDLHPIDFWLMADDGARISLDTGPIMARLRQQADGTYVCELGHHILVGEEIEQINGIRADFGVEMTNMRGDVVTDVRPVVLVYDGSPPN